MTTQSSTIAASQTDPFSKKYKILSKIGEGSYSEVLKCKNRDTGAVYACKRLKHCYRSWNQVNDIPEIVTLRKLARHPNILQMVEIHFDPAVGRVSLVFELMDMNLYELIKDRKRLLPESRVRVMMFQLMRALRHLHKHGIFHRDVKPENILLKNDLLKLGDLGSVRGLYSRPPYTEYISTRWYRSPECLLTCGYYSFKMDVWAAGCVFYEILTLRPLFPGSSELDQINRVHNVLGPPPSKILQKFTKHAEIERDYSRHTSKQARLDTIKRVLGEMKTTNYDWYFTGKEPKGVDTLLPIHVSAEAKDLLKHLLQYDPDSRPSSHRALQHAYFKDLREQAQRAAREKLPSVTGPIVTIVGDEGGLEVAADDNANPVDLATLGDAKLKLKAQIKKPSDPKDSKDSSSTALSKPTKKISSTKLTFPSIPHAASNLKEAGEMFVASCEPDELDKKRLLVQNASSNSEGRKGNEEKAKHVARNIANLKYGGDAVMLPYQKIFLDEEEGDGLPKIPTTNSTAEAMAEEKQKQVQAAAAHLGRRMKLEVERKRSMTLVSSETTSTPTKRGFPLDFIDKSSLTPDVLTRINENRRIAHMQPIEVKNPGRTNHKEEPRRHEESPAKDSHYNKKVDLKPFQRKTPLSPNVFSPRHFHLKKPDKEENVKKGDKTSYYGYSSKEATSQSNSDSRDREQSTNSPKNGVSGGSHALNKQVKDILANSPMRKYMSKNVEVKQEQEKASHRTQTETLKTFSKNHLMKGSVNDQRKKYDYEKKNENVHQRGSFTNFSPRIRQDTRNIGLTGRHADRSYHDRKSDKEHYSSSPREPHSQSPSPNVTSHHHPDSGAPRKSGGLVDRKDFAYTRKERANVRVGDYSQQAYSERESEKIKQYEHRQRQSGAEKSDRHDRSIVRHRTELNRIQDKYSHHERHGDHHHHHHHHTKTVEAKDSGSIHDKLYKDFQRVDLELLSGSGRSTKHSYEQEYSNFSTRKAGLPESNKYFGHKSVGYLDNYDSMTTISPTNIRKLIENRRKKELVDTDTDGDNYPGGGLAQESNNKRKRRSKYSTHSSANNPHSSERGHDINNNEVRGNKYTPRQLLGQKFSEEDASGVASRIFPAGQHHLVKHSTPTSMVNKQVREILAEMRKRRDMLEDKVTKDTNATPRTTNNSKVKSKISDILRRSTNIPRRTDLAERYGPNHLHKDHNDRSYNVNSKVNPYQSNVTSVVESNSVRPVEKVGRRRNNYRDNDSPKLGTRRHGSGIFHKATIGNDSEDRIEAKVVDSSGHHTPTKHNASAAKGVHQSQTGADSKVFPRNRYGSTLQKK